MAAEKYLGAPSDEGEWWCDRHSEAIDMGPGVSFYIRCGEDGGNGPHLTCCYGLREDVCLDRVQAEAERILAEYQKPDRWHPEGRTLQGPLRKISIKRWRPLTEVLNEIQKSHSIRNHKAANVAAGKIVWSLEDTIYDCTGSTKMTARVIELVGMEALQKMYDETEVT